ncbi:threonine synthase [Leucobacter sp. M11]|uniref:threonine synthase n=1 Tax=Leucobacter sp. M11 TaxID=2993565 RepID=UPI002D7F6DEC|nr:threonine synthase [Leucobacter sp. M11]MEB4613160.1 threonine synthase [Leucobacter sp. M11]
MKFLSTRGQMQPKTFSDVLLDGLGPDGGLVVPEQVPTISAEQREAWRSLSYAELAAQVIGHYATDIPEADLATLTAAAYSPEAFPTPGTVPLTPLSEQVTLVGLSEGPTLAFKDLAMQFLGQVIPYVLARSGGTLNILGATSGDTGSAAEHAFRGKPGLSVFMLSPLGRMSDVQRAQMYSIDDDNVHNLAVDGVFDDCQNLVKAISNDAAFKADHRIGAVNSINFGRISAQIVYYFWAWLRATDAVPAEERAAATVTFAIPSGNFGNIYSGHLARRMGLPIAKLILATNENNVLDEFFRTGIYTPRSRELTHATSSPSMDISKASNLERFVWDVLGPEEFVTRWTRLETEGTLDLSDHLPRFAAEFGFVSGTSTHADRVATIRSCFEASGTVVDPHTADALAVLPAYLEPGVPTLVLETAKPEKFSVTVAEALGEQSPATPAHILALLELEQHVVEIANDAEQLKAYVAEHALLTPAGAQA